MRNLSRSQRRICSRFFALLAIQMGTQVLFTSSDSEHPRAIREWRLVPYVLPMPTGQISHPVTIVILVISDDRLLHAVTMLLLQMKDGERSDQRSSYGMFSAAIRLAQLKVTVSRTAAQAAEQRENTASALPHPDRNFRQI